MEEISEKEYPHLGKGCKPGYVRFLKPEGVKVEDVIIRMAIVADGVPICKYGDESKSVEVISGTIRSVNGVKQESRAFTQYLTVVPGNDIVRGRQLFEIMLEEIIRSITVIGKVGWYVKKNGVWKHIRLVIEEVLADYQGLCSIVHHGSPSADWMCLKCPAHREYYCPLVNTVLHKDWGRVIADKKLKTSPSSSLFLHPHSLYRATTMVAAFHNEPGSSLLSVTDFMKCNDEEEQKLLKKEEDGIREDFRYIDKRYLFQWSPVSLTLDLANEYYRDSVCNPENFSEQERETVCPEIDCSVPEGREKFFSFITLLPPNGITGLDQMHTLSGVVGTFSSEISGVYVSKEHNKKIIADEILNYYNHPLNTIPCTLGEVPKLTVILAYKRLEELNNKSYSWLQSTLVVEKHINDLTCEQRIVLYLNLFLYIYQDSLHIPIIHYMKKILCMISRLYTQCGGKTSSSFTQAKESYYLSQLQANSSPSFQTTLIHLTNHMFSELMYHGSLQNRTCFLHERNYKKTKERTHACRYVVDWIAEHEIMHGICSMVCFDDNNAYEVQVTKFGKPTLSGFSCNRDVLQLLKYSLIDDVVQSLNTSKLRMTYTESLQCDPLSQEKWIRENARWFDLVEDLSWDGKYYPSVTWRSKQYKSLLPPTGDQAEANQWIIDNQRSLAWVYNSNETITYYIVRAFVVGSYGKSHTVLALCNPISTFSSDNEVYTPHSLVVSEDWLQQSQTLHFVSLYRLHVGCLAYWYGEKMYVGLSVMRANLYQFLDGLRDNFLESLKEKAKRKCI